MKILMTGGALFVAGLTLSAQTPPPLTAAAPPSSKATVARPATTDSAVMLTGCLRQWDDGVALVGVEAPTAAGDVRDDAAAVPVGKTPIYHVYVLAPADPGVSLNQHLDERVELEGTLSVSSKDPRTPIGTSGRAGNASYASQATILHVSSLKTVAASCS